MKQIMMMLALASAAGLASPALAQGQTGGEPQQNAASPAAAQAPAEQPPSPEETLAEHFRDFIARVEARQQASDEIGADIGPQQEFRYHPAW